MNWKLLNRVWHANLGMAAAITLGLIAISCPFIAHKGDDLAIGKALMDIHYGKFLPAETRWIWIDSQGFLLLFLVGSGLLMHRKAVKKAANVAADDPAVPGSSVTLLDFGTGMRGTALATEGEKRGLRLFRCAASGIDKLSLAQERWLVIIPGETGYTVENVQLLTTLCGQIKPGSAKRLQYAIAAADGADAMLAALAVTGGQAMKLPAGEFETAVLEHLSSQSEVLKKTAKKTASPPAVSAAAKPAVAGFTMVETLGSLGVMALLIAGGAGALQRMSSVDRVSTAAREFEALVRDARDLARRENTWVRVTLLPPGKEQSWLQRGESEHPRMGAAMYVLRRPGLETSAVTLGSATSSLETDYLQESVSSSIDALPPSLRAGWEHAPGHATWKLWDSNVSVASTLLREEAGNSPWLLRGTEQADFSEDLTLTPLVNGWTLTTASFASTDRFTDSEGDTVSARDVWGSLPVKRWVESGAPHVLMPMPAFDISPTGALVGASAAGTLTFVFRHKDERSTAPRKVIVQTSTGDTWVE